MCGPPSLSIVAEVESSHAKVPTLKFCRTLPVLVALACLEPGGPTECPDPEGMGVRPIAIVPLAWDATVGCLTTRGTSSLTSSAAAVSGRCHARNSRSLRRGKLH